MAFDDFCISSADSKELAGKLIDEKVLIPVETGFFAAPGILFSYIGEANHPDTGDPIPGICAFIGLDIEVIDKSGDIKTALEAQKIDSVIPLRTRFVEEGKVEEALSISILK